MEPEELVAIWQRRLEENAERERAEREIIAGLERRLSIQPGFFHDLQRDGTDWSFTVRLFAFIEASLIHATLLKLGQSALQDYVERLSFQGRGSLLELARSLEVVDKTQVRFLEVLARVRNGYAHGLANIDKTLPEYLETLERSKRASMLQSLMMADQQPPTAEDAGSRMLVAMTRGIIWSCALGLCMKLALAATVHETQQRSNEQMRQTVDAYFTATWDVLGDIVKSVGGSLGSKSSSGSLLGGAGEAPSSKDKEKPAE